MAQMWRTGGKTQSCGRHKGHRRVLPLRRRSADRHKTGMTMGHMTNGSSQAVSPLKENAGRLKVPHGGEM